jgi:hypothetical protein
LLCESILFELKVLHVQEVQLLDLHERPSSHHNKQRFYLYFLMLRHFNFSNNRNFIIRIEILFFLNLEVFYKRKCANPLLFNGKNSISNVFSVIAGSDIFVLGRLTPFRLQFTTLYHSGNYFCVLSVSTISNISFSII